MTERMPWKYALMRDTSSIQEAIVNLDRTGFKIVLSVDESGRLLGTVSDGDIRRGLLKAVSLDEPISVVANKSPLVAPENMSRDAVRDWMIVNKLQQVPVVNNDRQVIGLHMWDELSGPKERQNIMVIMVGGKGTRLGSKTEKCPKPLLPVGGKPMLEHIIEKAKTNGISRFLLAIGYLGHMIEEYFGDGRKWGVDIKYLREEEPLGTAGALSLMEPASCPTLVTNGDVMTDIGYGEILDFHDLHVEAAATMAVHLHEWQHPYGVVNISGIDIVSLEEKPLVRTYVNAGVYVIESEAIACLAQSQPCDMPDFFGLLKDAGKRTIIYPMHEPWIDVGSPEDLTFAQSQKDSELN